MKMKNIRTIWDEAVSNYSNLTALKWLEKKEIHEKTYGEIDRIAKNVRTTLEELDFAGDHIALIGTSSPEWVESYLGIVTGVNVAVPLDAALPDEELIDLLNRSDSVALFLSPAKAVLKDKVLANCPAIRKVFMLTPEELEGFEEKDYDVPGAAEYEIATIIYTSGTTGKSKGVMLTQENLSENVRSVEYSAAPGCVVLSVLPIHHAYCLVMDYLKTLSLGCTICINDSFMHMVRNMGIFKPEVMLMVPLMIETIFKKVSALGTKAKEVFGGNLRTIFTGGAHLDPYYIDKFEEFGVDILEGYGMSECSPVITSNSPDDHKKGSIGRPLKNVEISFEDGEILVRGSSVMRGYYKMPKETEETLRDGWLHTGDKGYLDEDGYLFINGRVKNLIIMSNGENVSPEEIENKLALNPLIAEVVVTGENNGLTARVYPDLDEAKARGLSAEELEKELWAFIGQYNSSQPTYRYITALVIRQTPFIRNTTGKIKRQEATRESSAA
jgi:long-chain acyl-CoA synthetase